jgi:dihydrofolate reductase
MRKLSVFENISLDGFFTDANNDMSAFHLPNNDPEFDAWTAQNAKGGRGTLLFGRKTYEQMARFWPSEMAKQQMPEVAEGMNRMDKIVFSRTLKEATWNNTKLIKGDLAAEVRKLKASAGEDLLVMGSGQIVAQLTKERLIDAYIFVIVPIVLGSGRHLFDGVEGPLPLKRIDERVFARGPIVATYGLA